MRVMNISSRHFDVRVAAGEGLSAAPSCVVVDATDGCDDRIPPAHVPARRIRLLPPARHSHGCHFDRYDFLHRCRLEFAQQPSLCEWLVETARSTTLWLTHRREETIQYGVRELKRHLELLEAQRRYDRGWMIGGHTFPIRTEIERLGGLWLGKHKTWTMPDRASWLYALSLLPGDF
jgi:hypothetical protein